MERLRVPEEAGADAVAVRLDTQWGSCVVLNEFRQECMVGGIRFEGHCGVVGETNGGKAWLASCGATTLEADELGFSGTVPVWGREMEIKNRYEICPKTPRPEGWPELVLPGTWVLVGDGDVFTGLPVSQCSKDSIRVRDFPLPDATEFRLPSTFYRKK